MKYSYFLLLALFVTFSFNAYSQTETVEDEVVEEAAEEAVEAVEEAAEAVVDEDDEAVTEVSAVWEESEPVEVEFHDSDTIELYGSTFSGLYDLDDVVPNYKVFLSGENHTYTESNARLWLKMIKYLHKNANMRNVMFEYGYSYGYLVNEYLQTGDTALFNSLKNFAYIEYGDAIKDLREFNAELDSADRIQLVGLDIDRGIYPIVKLLDYLLPESFDAHDSIIIHLESIRSIASYNDSKLEEDQENPYVIFNYKTTPTLELVQENFLAFEEEYKKVLGENFDLFRKTIIDNFNARQTWKEYDNTGAAQQYVYRETYMHKRFLEEDAKTEGAWFGQFGRCHTTRTRVTSNGCDWYMFKSLANRINNTKGEAYKDSVLTLGIAYKGDQSMGIEWVEFQDVFDKYFEMVPDSSIVLLNLKDDSVLDSAFGEDFDYMFLNSNTERGEAYTDIYYDYDYDDLLDFTAKINFGITTQNYDLSGMNNVVVPSGFLYSFNNTTNFFTLNMNFGEGAFRSGYSFSWMMPSSLEYSSLPMDAERSLKFSGYKIKSVSMINLTPSLRAVDLIGGFSLNYESYKLRIYDKNPVGTIDQGYVGGERLSTFNNPLFGADLFGQLDINLGWLNMFYGYGYTFDLSKPKWRIEDNILGSGMETKFSGFYQTFGVGLVF